MQQISVIALVAAASTALAGCASTMDKLESIGKPPPMSKVYNPTVEPDYEPLSWPLPENSPPPKQYANSLWQPGARAFFRDQRAARVGDILKVNIKIKDKAELDNETDRDRTGSDSISAPSVFGLQSKIFKPLPGVADVSNLATVNTAGSHRGTGAIKREETIETEVAALVTQVLPNGNLAIHGSQEIRINNEIREISVEGVVRPQDIDTNNTVDSSQIAQARIIYGGRGQISDVQQPRWGSQVIEAVSPF
ncbi:MAG: flagellar basal body L-ring protein FlgH [Alphaproteobacteria bacterium]